MGIKHAFTSIKSDGGDNSLVKPSDWNAYHTGSPYPLDKYTIDSTYGDDFTEASLNSRWTRRNYTSGAEEYQLGIDQTWLRINPASRSNGDGYFQTAPSGDFTIACKLLFRGFISHLGFGLSVIDSSGTGVSTLVYAGSPNAPLLTRITTYTTYQGTYVEPGSTGTNPNISMFTTTSWGQDRPIWYYVRKNNTDYYFAYSTDGELWSHESSALNATFTVDRIGFIHHPLGTAVPSALSRIDIDWFNKIA